MVFIDEKERIGFSSECILFLEGKKKKTVGRLVFRLIFISFYLQGFSDGYMSRDFSIRINLPNECWGKRIFGFLLLFSTFP